MSKKEKCGNYKNVNTICGNGLCGNGVCGNGISGNGLSGNGVCGNGISGNGLSGNGFALEETDFTRFFRSAIEDIKQTRSV